MYEVNNILVLSKQYNATMESNTLNKPDVAWIELVQL